MKLVILLRDWDAEVFAPPSTADLGSVRRSEPSLLGS